MIMTTNFGLKVEMLSFCAFAQKWSKTWQTTTDNRNVHLFTGILVAEFNGGDAISAAVLFSSVYFKV